MAVFGRRTVRARVAFWALAGVALLIGHDAVWLVQVGPGEELAMALRSAGHGYWGFASLLIAAAGLITATAMAVHVRRLHRRVAELGAPVAARHRLAGLGGTWLRLFGVVAVGFAIQENLEHGIGHGHLRGFGALAGPEYPLALPVLAAITAVAALVAVLVRGFERALVDGIAAALRAVRLRAPRSVKRPPRTVLRRLLSPLAHASAGRAPPALLVHA